MSNKNIKIPGRLESAAVEGVVAGADAIMDDDLMLDQSTINSIVLGGAVSNTLSVSPSTVFIGEQSTISLNAQSNISNDSIVIKGGNTGNEGITGSGTTLSGTDVITPVENTIYSATFKKGGLTKSASASVVAVYPVWYGSGSTWESATNKASVRRSPAGTYNVTVSTSGSYVWFVVPSTMTITRATKNGFDYPLEAPQNVTKEDVAYKAYRSSNTYDAGIENIVLY